ncbi:MAG TPA: hypothetical protein VHN36_13960 [Ilumatobacteraceae bacterium]|nr:hypothetical protein [Ilumatobacteraceae bacterium]
MASEEELEQIHGIGEAMRERLRRDHEIHRLADLARLTDTAVDELQQALRAARAGRVDVSRWRDEARRLVSEPEANGESPLATFVVEARRGSSGTGGEPSFVVHHVEADETSETSNPLPTVEVVAAWMRDRVAEVSSPREGATGGEPADLSERMTEDAPPWPRRPVRRGRLRISGLEVHRADDRDLNGTTRSLLADAPVTLDGAHPVVLVGNVSLVGAVDWATCRMRCRLHDLDSEHVIEYAWGGDSMLAPGGPDTEMASAPVSIPLGAYRGELFAEDRSQSVRRGFCELPLITVN